MQIGTQKQAIFLFLCTLKTKTAKIPHNSIKHRLPYLIIKQIFNL